MPLREADSEFAASHGTVMKLVTRDGDRPHDVVIPHWRRISPDMPFFYFGAEARLPFGYSLLVGMLPLKAPMPDYHHCIVVEMDTLDGKTWYDPGTYQTYPKDVMGNEELGHNGVLVPGIRQRISLGSWIEVHLSLIHI